jgi:PAS domain S-box-containing protein
MSYPYSTGKKPFDTSLLDNLPVAVYTCDRDGYIVSYNQAAAKLWGREPMIGKEQWGGAWKAYYADGSPLNLDNYPMPKILQDGIEVEVKEVIIERPDGTTSYVLPHPSPIFNADGTVKGIVNTLVDITEYRRDTNQAMLAAIIESSDDAIISKTLEGKIISWNGAAEKLFGYTGEEIIGQYITILIPPDRLEEEDLIIGKIRNSERINHFETIRLTKDKREIQISLTVSPIKGIDGRIIGASKIARDISKQKNAEERLQRYAENLEILNTFGKEIAEDMDIQSILQKVTDATTQLTQAAFGAFFYNKTDERSESYMLYTLSGVPREAFAKFDMPRNTAVFHPTFSGEGTVRVDDITKDPRYGKSSPHFGMPKGHLPVVSYLAVPVISKSGAVIGGLFYGHPKPGMFNEEHEHLVAGVAAQAAVTLDNAKLYEEIKVLNAKKDEFIGLASHELKTPVTSINGYLQLIDRNLPADDRNKTFITKALNQVNKLTVLISDLLDVSKIQTGKLPFSYSTFNMTELLHEVSEIMQQTHPSHRILVEQSGDELIVEADHQRMEQVIINLISNAVKYSPNANHVIVSASAGNDKIKVAVQDFGIGIQKDHLSRIFNRFYRVENLAAHMSGLGIGLYICNEIVKRHKGKLHVESVVNQGSVFSFEIPVSQ